MQYINIIVTPMITHSRQFIVTPIITHSRQFIITPMITPSRQFSWEQIDSVVCTMQPRIESDAELSQCFAYDARLRGLVRQLTVSERKVRPGGNSQCIILLIMYSMSVAPSYVI